MTQTLMREHPEGPSTAREHQPPTGKPSRAERFRQGLPLVIVLTAIGFAHAWNLSGWPRMGNDDEGTYMDRAWAVQTGLGAHHSPAPYTYWYDHPPFGWMQLALWTWLTHTFRAGVNVVDSGRIAMVGFVVVAAALVYLVTRRVGAPRWTGWLAALLFGLSPLSLDVARMVMLDTIGLPWIVAAFALALSPGRRFSAYIGSGLCFAGAVLSKETYLLLLPALVVTTWLHVPRPNRRLCLAALLGTAALFGSFYLLYAILKGELFPGPGHVSLIGAIDWQLFQRSGSGSVFNPHSGADSRISSWLRVDPWLLGLGLCLSPIGLAVRRLRGITLAYLTFVVEPLRGGYLPATFVTGALPFAALVAATSTEATWRWASVEVPVRLDAVRRALGKSRGGFHRQRAIGRHLGQVGVLAVLGVVVAFLVPRWWSGDAKAFTVNDNVAMTQVATWVARHVPRNAVVVTDDDLWPEFVDDGFPPKHIVWFYELDLDPEVRARFPEGWRQVDWVVTTPTLRSGVVAIGSGLPQVVDALAHSVPVVRFGTGRNWTSVRRVVHHGHGQPPWWLPGYGSGHPPSSGPQKGERV
jgi:hypothetical protein